MKIVTEMLLRKLKTGTRYISPFFYVETESLGCKFTGASKQRGKKGYLFRSGNWDMSKMPISAFQESDPRYLFYKEHLFENVPLKKTTIYEYHRERQARGRPRLGMEDEEALISGLKKYVEIFRDIERSRKVTPNLELTGQRRNEIGCVIGRNGEILKASNGNNRFSIATLLHIPSIPVQINFIHMDLLEDICATSGILPGQKVNRYLFDRISAKV